MPLLRYVAFVGGSLLLMLLIAGAYLPAGPVDGGGQPASKPVILIESSRKWPERIVYDTSLPTTLAIVRSEAPAVASPGTVRRSPLNSLAQLTAPPPPKRANHVATEKRTKMAKRFSQPGLAYVQEPRRPPDSFAAWW